MKTTTKSRIIKSLDEVQNLLEKCGGPGGTPGPCPGGGSQGGKKPITGLALTGQGGGRMLSRGTRIEFFDGEHKGKTAVVQGVIPMRYNKEQVTYRLTREDLRGSLANFTMTAASLMKFGSLID